MKIRESFKDHKTNDAERDKYAKEIKEKRKKYLEKVRKLRGGDRKQQEKATKNIKGQKNRGNY